MNWSFFYSYNVVLFLLQELKYLKEDSAIKEEQFAAEVATVILHANSFEFWCMRL